MAELLADVEGVEIVRAQTPVELLNILAGDISLLVVVDAVESLSEPGAIHVFDSMDKISSVPFWRSTHTLTLPEVVGVAESLGSLPEKILVFGIEGESFEEGVGLSERVERACRRVALEIRRLVDC